MKVWDKIVQGERLASYGGHKKPPQYNLNVSAEIMMIAPI